MGPVMHGRALSLSLYSALALARVLSMTLRRLPLNCKAPTAQNASLGHGFLGDASNPCPCPACRPSAGCTNQSAGRKVSAPDTSFASAALAHPRGGIAWQGSGQASAQGGERMRIRVARPLALNRPLARKGQGVRPKIKPMLPWAKPGVGGAATP